MKLLGICLILIFISLFLISFAYAEINIGETPQEIKGVVVNFGIVPRVINIINQTTVGGNLTNFTSLIDTPSSYSGEGDNCVAVKNDETGLEFISCTTNPFDQSLNTTDNVTFNNVTITGWFQGLFDITVYSLNNFLSIANNGSTIEIDFNETKLNGTIDTKITEFNDTLELGDGAAGIWTNDTDPKLAEFSGNISIKNQISFTDSNITVVVNETDVRWFI